ncbi:RNA polymerase sigma-54 factor [Paenibacillus mucilaginosus]|uniref:RNA polymerase factor sigma-54 n=1 Tax=Paenibacillus mucilaginosus TaxID=61624 RepID=UPI003D240473
MRPGIGLTQALSTKTLLTAELHQSLHLLQLPAQELIRYAEEQALDNPLLELDLYGGSRLRKQGRGRPAGGGTDPLQWVPAGEETLERQLLGQLRTAGLPPAVYKAAAYLAGNLDERGYLTLTPEEAAAELQLPEGVVTQALEALQSLEPAGVGARTLQECLLLQIARDPAAQPWALQAVRDSWPQLCQGRPERIAVGLGITREEAAGALAYIRRLDPRPGSSCGPVERAYVVPDAEVFLQQGELVVRMNPDALPAAAFRPEYEAQLRQTGCPRTAAFLQGKRSQAQSLVYGLQQRRVTLLRVIRAIFEEQEAFLAKGWAAVHPLTLKQIAQRLDLHESTVSRAVQHKYVRTPYGVRELKAWFTSGVRTADGETASSAAVKTRIREWIAGEDKRRPYSDQKLAELLAADGLAVSRRTVAKYREELHLLSSALRKTIM